MINLSKGYQVNSKHSALIQEIEGKYQQNRLEKAFTPRYKNDKEVMRVVDTAAVYCMDIKIFLTGSSRFRVDKYGDDLTGFTNWSPIEGKVTIVLNNSTIKVCLLSNFRIDNGSSISVYALNIMFQHFRIVDILDHTKDLTSLIC